MSAHVLIAGGGIGGLSASLCLAKRGFTVEVFEQAPELGEIGAGIQLSPNCLRVLFDVGLEESLREVAFVPLGTQMRAWRSGRVITESALGDTVRQRYGYPYFHVHRADLIAVLAAACQRAPGITVHVDARVDSIDQSEVGVALRVAGSVHAGDVLIGADGIHSAVRKYLFGDDAPVFTGNVAWRALVPTERLPEGLVRPMATAWWGPGKHFVHYYVRRGELVNCVCVVEKEGWEVEGWNERGDYAELKADFRGWHRDVQELIDNADRDSLYKWGLFDRQPMSQWGRDRVTLLGDACHPTLPFMAQGAAMAIEDGAVLAGLLVGAADLPSALQRYEDLRRGRTAAIQRGSRGNARIFHMRGLPALMRNLAARRASNNRLHAVFSYDALHVPERNMLKSN